MGRKRGLSAHARENAVAEEVAEAVEMEQKEAVRSTKPNEELFIVDTSGSKRRRRKLEKEASEKFVSRVEKKIIMNKYLCRAASKSSRAKRTPLSDPWEDDGDSQATAVDAKGQADVGAQVTSSISNNPPSKPLVLPSSGGGDTAGKPAGNASLKPVTEGFASSKVAVSTTEASGVAVGGVESDEFLAIPQKPGRPVKRPKPSTKDLAKLGVCHPGQSYNPTPYDHDDVLASAVAVELRRQEAIDEEAAPVSAGMSKETLEVLVGDEDDESSDDGEDGEGGVGASLGGPTPATGKLTRAQRNKQKRTRAAELELQRRRKKKEMLKTIDKISAVQHEVAEKERLREERRRTKRLLKGQKTRQMEEGVAGGIFGPSAGVATMTSAWQSNKSIIEGRSVPVNLSEELHGSLRQLKAQGSVLDDKVELLKANKAHPDKKRAKERAKKASRGFRKKHKFKTR